MIRVIDVFAGAGGFGLGAEAGGCVVEHAIEIDAWACDTLRHNRPAMRVTQADIRGLSDQWFRSEIPRYPDLLIGGPPCQGFSHAGPARKDPRDPRNSLFQEFIRAARLLEPAGVIIENVPGLLRALTADGRSVRGIIEEELQLLGYSTVCLVLQAERYGVPQLRRRVFFVGVAQGAPPDCVTPTHAEAPTLLDGQLAPVLTLRDAISDLPVVDVGDAREPIAYQGPPRNAFQRAMREGAGPQLFNHVPMRHSARVIQRFRQIAPGQSQSHVSREHAPRLRVRTAEDGPSAYDQNNRRMHWDRPCHTLAASFYANFVHPELHRNFTPREGARIQTFPDSYEFKGKPTVVSAKLLTKEGRLAERHLCQYNQIGNAVPPLLARALVDAALTAMRLDAVLPSGT